MERGRSVHLRIGPDPTREDPSAAGGARERGTARPGRARGWARGWFRGLKQLVPSAEERARAATRRARARGKAAAHMFPVDVPSAVDQPTDLRDLTVKCGIVHVASMHLIVIVIRKPHFRLAPRGLLWLTYPLT